MGVSGYAVRPARVRKEKPRVSAFISADVGKIKLGHVVKLVELRAGLQWGELMEQTDRAHTCAGVGIGVAGDLLEHLGHLLAAHDFFRVFHTGTYPAVFASP